MVRLQLSISVFLEILLTLPKAPKVNCNPTKLSSIVSYFHRSGVAHTIKDLEKHLPSIASINGMQVKDYLQTLADESRINVEKIGSGNWYWSFPSQEFKTRQNALDVAKVAHDKQAAVVKELRDRVTELEAQHEDDDDMLDSVAVDRAAHVARVAELETSTTVLRKELAAYSDTDPVELEKKVVEAKRAADEIATVTDDIYSMESWFQKMGADEHLAALRSTLYGTELDEETGTLKELE